MSDKDNKDKEKLAPVSLATMLGQGNSFLAQGREYIVKPLKLKHVLEFQEDKIPTAIPYFGFTDKESIEKFEKWIPRILFKGDKSITLEEIIEDEWDLDDFKKFWSKVIGISG